MKLQNKIAFDRGYLDVVEDVAQAHDWVCNRENRDEVILSVQGQWCDYHAYFIWEPDTAMIYIACLSDISLVGKISSSFYRLLSKVNQKMGLGHFDILGDQTLAFRYSLPLRGEGNALSFEQTEDIVDLAIAEYETYYPAFQQVVQHKKTPEEALGSVFLETLGEA